MNKIEQTLSIIKLMLSRNLTDEIKKFFDQNKLKIKESKKFK